MLKVFVRWSPRASVLRRPSWYTDTACLHNAAAVLSGPNSDLTLLADGDPPGSVGDLPWDSVVRLPNGTNSQSFLRSLDFALESCNPADTLYLVEQDYLHVQEARAVLTDGVALNPDGYVTLFDDPLYYWPSTDVAPVSAETRLVVGTTRHWRTAPSTTMTFAAPTWVLSEDYALIDQLMVGTVKPPDRMLWREISRKGRTLLSSVPGAATHVETTALAPLMDWRALASIDHQPVRLPTHGHWREVLAAVSEVAVGAAVPASALDCLDHLGVKISPLRLQDISARTKPWWALVTTEEKDELDTQTRGRSTALVGVIVCSDIQAYSGRWYSGRDWFLADLVEAKAKSRHAEGGG